MVATKGLRVLVVEDEHDLREMLILELTLKGYHPMAAMDGLEALEVLQNERAAAVVTDVRMPRMGGPELLDRLKTLDARQPPVVLMSAFHDILPEEAYGHGAEAVLAKPFRLRDMESTVARLVQPVETWWQLPPAALPVLEVSVSAARFGDGRDKAKVSVGRGGLCISADAGGVRTGDHVQFDLRADAGPVRRLTGTGVVRWATRSACGIEFEYIEGRDRPALVQWLDASPPRAYIPRPG